MPPVPRNAASSRAKATSKDTLLPSGKENARPSATRRKVSFVGADREQSRRRVSLSSNDDRKKENGGVKTTRAIGESSFVRKTPFHVHCDERNVPRKSETPGRPRVNSSADPGEAGVSVKTQKEDRKQVVGGLETLRLVPQKRPVGDEGLESRKLLPSKIPRRSRSTSVPVDDTKAQGASRRSASADVKNGSRRERWGRAAASKFGWGSGRAIDKRTEEKPAGEGARILLKKIDSKGARSSRSSFSANSITVRGPRAIDRIRARLLSANEPRSSDGGCRSQAGSTETPVDVAGPPSFPLKGVVRRTMKLAVAGPRENREGSASKGREVFPYELLYHVDYHEDLPLAEREREERSPRLSENFLGKHINAEQRRLVVIFLIRLGTHCRYPSFIIYQAVKLFDAVMDRIPVETTYIQLTALASLWIALKKQQNFHKIPTATTMVSLARELYLGREDLLMSYERKILLALNFNVTFADAFSLFAYYLISCKCYINISEEMTKFLYHSGGYLIDLTLLDEHFCRLSDSLLALTAMELALGLVIDAVVDQARPRWLFWRGLLFAAAASVANKFRDEEIDRSRVAMLRRVLTSGRKNCGFDVVHKKYSRSRYGRISVTLLERASRVSRAETFDP